MSKPLPPAPPAGPEDARRFPRFELFASVELAHEDTTLVLPARNISLGGMFLSADGNDLTVFPVGEEVEVMLFDALDEGQTAVRALATVVRRDAEGLGLTWASTDPVVARQLASLLARLNPL